MEMEPPITDLRQTPNYGKFMQAIGWRTEPIGQRQQIFIKPLGPVAVAKIQRIRLIPNWNELNRLLANYKVIMIKIEPDQTKLNWGPDLSSQGYKKEGGVFICSKTIRVNLRGGWENIEKQIKKDARYCIRRAEAGNKLRIIKNDPELFYKMWRKSAQQKGLWIPNEKDFARLMKAFGNKGFCLMIIRGNSMAGATVLEADRRAYYFYAGANTSGKQENLPYLVVKEAMAEASARGLLEWDFEGIWDLRNPVRGWKGFSHFKKSFGGEEVEFPGMWGKWRWPS